MRTGQATTRRASIIALQRCFRWAEKMGYISRSPMRSLDKPQADSPRPSRDATRVPHNSCLPARTRLFATSSSPAWETGARPQELLRVESRHVDLRNAVGCSPERIQRQESDPASYYLSEQALEITEGLVATHNNGPLFRNSRGRAWTAFAVNCRFRALRKKLNMNRLVPLSLPPHLRYETLDLGP